MLSSFLYGVTVSVGIRTTHLAFRHRSRRVDIDGRLGGYKLIWREGYGLDTPEDPGLVVLHGGRGITDQIQHQAQYLADQGYVTLIPDLYGGKIPPEIFDEQYLQWGFDREVAVRDLQLHISGSITLLGRLELLDLRWVARFPSWQLLRNARPRAHPTALYPSAGYPPTAFARTSSRMACRFNVIFLGLRRAERLRH